MPTCQYCGSEQSNDWNLKRHLKSNKACLKVRELTNVDKDDSKEKLDRKLKKVRLNLCKENIKRCLDKLPIDIFSQGDDGDAFYHFIVEKLLTKDGNPLYLCSDKQRNTFTFIDMKGNKIKDQGAKLLLKKIKGQLNYILRNYEERIRKKIWGKHDEVFDKLCDIEDQEDQKNREWSKKCSKIRDLEVGKEKYIAWIKFYKKNIDIDKITSNEWILNDDYMNFLTRVRNSYGSTIYRDNEIICPFTNIFTDGLSQNEITSEIEKMTKLFYESYSNSRYSIPEREDKIDLSELKSKVEELMPDHEKIEDLDRIYSITAKIKKYDKFHIGIKKSLE